MAEYISQYQEQTITEGVNMFFEGKSTGDIMKYVAKRQAQHGSEIVMLEIRKRVADKLDKPREKYE